MKMGTVSGSTSTWIRLSGLRTSTETSRRVSFVSPDFANIHTITAMANAAARSCRLWWIRILGFGGGIQQLLQGLAKAFLRMVALQLPADSQRNDSRLFRYHDHCRVSLFRQAQRCAVPRAEFLAQRRIRGQRKDAACGHDPV